SVEDSMSQVHLSTGRLDPASPQLLSEVAVVCRLARRVLPSSPVPWQEYEDDYATIRAAIGRVVPGCVGYDDKVARPGGFTMPHPPRDERRFETASGKAQLTVNRLE